LLCEGLETREVQGLEFKLAVGQRVRQIEFELARVEIARDLEREAGWLFEMAAFAAAPVWVRQRASHRSLNWGLGTELHCRVCDFWDGLKFDLVAGSPEYRAMVLRP
jgi:hypothetical protein